MRWWTTPPLGQPQHRLRLAGAASRPGSIRGSFEISRCRPTAPRCCAWLAASPPRDGVEICAPVHDAVLIVAPLDRLDEDVAAMRAAMREASSVVLAGYELRTDVKMVLYPDRYSDPRGEEMWRQVMRLIGGV